jgi:hypothetical protein
MARLGELLVVAGLLTAEQLERALRAQVMWGARLGTNLVELGMIELDELTSHLGRQHNLPSAFARHFEKVDRELQLLLPPELAESFSCVPLMRTGARRDIVLAAASPPTKKALARIAEELFVEPNQLIVSIAAELRIRYQLERVYGIARPARFMRAPGLEATSFPQFEVLEFEDSQVDNPAQPTAAPIAIDVENERTTPLTELDLEVDIEIDADAGPATLPVRVQPPEPEVGPPNEDDLAVDTALAEQPSGTFPALAELDDLPADVAHEAAVPRAVEEESSSGRARRKYVRTIADKADSERAVARISIRRVPKTPPVGIVESSTTGKTLGEATRAIRRSTDRDRVAELCMDTLFRFAPSCHAASFMVLRGQVATSWKGFCRTGAPPPEVAVPLDQPGLVPRAAQRNATARAPASDLGPIDQLLMVTLGHSGGELVIVPISISGSVMCVLAMVAEPDAPVATPESIAAAAGAAFARLMRAASR